MSHKLLGRTDFSDQFRKIIIRHKRIGFDLNVYDRLRAGSGVRLCDGPDLTKLFILVGWDWSFRLFLGPPRLK